MNEENSTDTKYPLNWNLDSLLAPPDSDDFHQCLLQFRHDIEELANYSDELPTVDTEPANVAAWVNFMQRFERVCIRSGDVASFIACHAAAEAENKTYQQIEAQLSALGPLQEKIASNVEYALKATDQGEFNLFLQSDPALVVIRFFFEEMRRNAQLRLPKEQEELANELAVDGIHAWGRLYDRLSGELRVPVMEQGEIVEKSVGQVQLDSPQRTVRQNNFYASDKSWSELAGTCADAINHIAGARLTRYRRLGGVDHLEVPCQHNRMRRETLDAMWRSVRARKDVLLKYFAAKADAMGLDRLTWYDVTAPYPVSTTVNNQVNYDQACDYVLDAFGEFSSELGEFASMSITDRWIEAENRSGKRQGGFCTGFSEKKQSRIFMTYTNSVDSMSTLAHELGHAYHSYVLRDQPFFLQDYPMNLAETASIFAEAVLGDYRLDHSDSTDEKIAILDSMLSDAVAYLMNIHARFLFEDRFHIERSEGELTADRLSQLMLTAQKEAFLNGLDKDGWNPQFWISKLHFYITGLPFYNFPYTFGYLLSLGVFALGKEGGAEFPERYRRLLLATGCQDTEKAVRSTLGYDLTTVDFWNKSLDVVEQRVERFLELI